MNTLQICSALGLFLTLVSGCHSDSNSGGNDGSADARKDDTRSPGTTFNSDVASGGCTSNGTTYQVGRSYKINCVTYTCASGGFVTSDGATPCYEAGVADKPLGRDAATDSGAASDVRLSADGTADTQLSEAGRSDTQRPVDTSSNKDTFVALDVESQVDTSLPVDLAPPEDTSLVTPDAAVQCIHNGTAYNVNDFFVIDACNYCVCLTTGDFACTGKVCATDAG